MKPVEVLHKILPQPTKPAHLPEQIYWLSGEGAGSWFHIEKLEKKFIIARYSPEGKLECKGIFKQDEGKLIQLSERFEITYLSHCAVVNIIQHNAKLKFNLIERC